MKTILLTALLAFSQMTLAASLAPDTLNDDIECISVEGPKPGMIRCSAEKVGCLPGHRLMINGSVLKEYLPSRSPLGFTSEAQCERDANVARSMSRNKALVDELLDVLN